MAKRFAKFIREMTRTISNNSASSQPASITASISALQTSARGSHGSSGVITYFGLISATDAPIRQVKHWPHIVESEGQSERSDESKLQ